MDRDGLEVTAGRGRSMPDDVLRLELGGSHVRLSTLVTAAGTFANLVVEVSRSLHGEPVEWTVEVEKGSVVLPATPQVPVDVRQRLVQAVASGLASVEQRAERPPYFTDRALVQARALANLSTTDAPIRVKDGTQPVTLTKQLVAHVDQVTREAQPRIGTVEGRLDFVDIHARSTFAIWERLTGTRVECAAGDAITVDDLRAALGRRVAVRGRIRSSKGGQKTRIDATELRVFPAEEELPSADEVRGILRVS